MTAATLPDVYDRLRGRAGALVDLDGTLMSAGRLLPGAAELLLRPPCPLVIVSNDSEHTPEQLSRRFRSLGVRLPADRFILAGITAIGRLAEDHPGARVMVLGSAAMRRAARNAGLIVTDAAAAHVLVMRDPDFTYARLAKAAAAVHAGAAVTLACPDLSHPGPSGEPVPEAGAIAAALQACAGPFSLRVVGKPEPDLFLAGAARLGISVRDCAMVGDNPDTDGLGARRLDMTFHLVARHRVTARATREMAA